MSRSKMARAARKQATVVHAIQPERLESRTLFSGITPAAGLAFTTFTGVGTTNSANALAAFQTAVGGVDNGNVATEQATGSRRINWDGVALDGTDFNGQTKTIVPNKVVGIPVNRFQTRGTRFGEVYAVSGDGFNSVNPGVSGQLNPFTPHNIFGHFNDVGIETDFVTPSAATTSPVQQATRGFGAIFLDVERPHDSYIEFFHGDDSLGKFFVPAGASGQPEFLGVLFGAAVVTKVEASPGSSPLFFYNNNNRLPGEADLSNGGTEDIAAVDDFVYAEPHAVVNPNILHATEGKTFSGTAGTFSTSNANPHASDFTATINWGDGTSSLGTVVSNGGASFKVNGTHAYAEEGTFNVSIGIHDKSGHSGTARSIAEVADAPLASSGLSFNSSTERAFTGTVARLIDADTGETDPATYNTVINWGDGTSTVGELVSLGGGKFAVRGEHQYLATGTFAVKVTINDVGGSTTTASSTAHVI